MKEILAITRKELKEYFGSPLAMIFIGAFLAMTLFTFFWVDTFFARGIADVRPLFRWMPLSLIFLVAALTMRQWSEEERSGTLEILLTLPVSTLQLVVGKFLAVVTLVAVAFLLTLFLPLTVSLLGNLDWGPVVGGYLASILLAAAYAAIGLFLSSRTDNQIVALITTVLICGLLYLIGSGGVTDFAGQMWGEVLRASGAGSRFESIERGVVDLRDLLYYLTITGIFLTLNVFSLKAKGWSTGERARPQRMATTITSLLLVVNLLFVNIWVYPLRTLRLDLTEDNEYTLSTATKNILSSLQEPLLIRGYFSEKTHPLLAPLVPAVRDMLHEYAVAAGGGIRLEIVDPAQQPEFEEEARQIYGIQPSPFQVADRYATSIVNAYFDILVQYGDQSEVLNFQDLIEVQPRRDGSLDVHLRNLEYDLTRTIKKSVYGFQSTGAMLASLESPAELTLYLTPATLPEQLASAPALIEEAANEIAAQASDNNFTYRVVDPTAAGSDIDREKLYELYGLQPIAVSLFSQQTYYFYPVLKVGDEAQVINLPVDMSKAGVQKSLEAALRRFSPGYLQVVGVWTPPQQPTQNAMGQEQQPISSWNTVSQVLREEYQVTTVALESGQLSVDVDVLLLVAPQILSDQARFAVDQYLMRGGAVIVAAGNYTLMPDQMTGGLGVQPLVGGVQDLLTSYGFTVEQSLVMDPQNDPFPVIVNRQVGNMQVQEVQAIDYPFFVKVLPDNMAAESSLVSNLPSVTLNWASPITVDEEQNVDREVTVLLRSTENAWVQAQPEQGLLNIQPDFQLYPELGFPPGMETGSYPLAVSAKGSFVSAFKDKPSPFEMEESAGTVEESAGEPATPETIPPTIEFSPQSARLVVIGSAEFLDDTVFEISSRLSGESYRNSLKLLQNAVAWATEDEDLLNIRARGTASRMLYPLGEGGQSFWEVGNYVLALVSLLVLGWVARNRQRNLTPLELLPRQRADNERELSAKEEVQA
ncbi:MAG: Gldg family protein [Chloroflexota bacterium]|nr:Gldg family protein [Chloroflexota bacterium]